MKGPIQIHLNASTHNLVSALELTRGACRLSPIQARLLLACSYAAGFVTATIVALAIQH